MMVHSKRSEVRLLEPKLFGLTHGTVGSTKLPYVHSSRDHDVASSLTRPPRLKAMSIPNTTLSHGTEVRIDSVRCSSRSSRSQ
jgi:hypothetical protein